MKTNFCRCSCGVVKTVVVVCEKLEIAWKHSHVVLVFPRDFSFLANFRSCFYNQGRREGGYPGLLPRGPGQKGARTQTVTNLQVLQDMK